jgi:hypothetical protein
LGLQGSITGFTGAQRRLLCRHGTAGLGELVVQLRQAFFRLGPRARQRRISGDFSLGVASISLGALQLRAGLGNRRILLHEIRLRLGQIGVACGDGRGGFVTDRLILAGVQPHQHVAAPHGLVIGHQHFTHVAADLRRHTDAVRLKIGVVGAFDETAVDPPPRGPGNADQQSDRHQRLQYSTGFAALAVDCVFRNDLRGGGRSGHRVTPDLYQVE